MEVTARTIDMHWLDFTVIFAYLAMLILMGYYHSRRQKTLKDYFLAGKSMQWLPVGLSLMTALNSGTDYIQQPSAMIQFGVMILTGPLSWFVLYPYVFYIILPMYRRVGFFTAYEYLEKRFSLAVRTLISAVYLIWRIAAVGVALYVPCFATAAAMGRIDLLIPMIIIVGAVVVAYTTMGGLKGVIWIDVVQFVIMFGGLLATVIIIVREVPGGLAAMIADIPEMGYTIREWSTQFPDDGTFVGGVKNYFTVPMTATGIFIVTLLGRLTIYTSDQAMIQRFQTTRTIRDARQGFLITAISEFIWLVVLCLIGVSLYTYFTQGGAELSPYLLENLDRVLPAFVAEVFPIGVTGLVIATIWAASITGFAGAINALSTVAMMDFVKRFFHVTPAGSEGTNANDKRDVFIGRSISIVIGALTILMAVFCTRMGTLVEIGLRIIGSFSGPMLAVFLLGFFTKRITSKGALWGALIGSACSIYALVWCTPDFYRNNFMAVLFPNPDEVRPISAIWIGSIGLIASLLSSWVVSLFTRANPDAVKWTWGEIVRHHLDEED